MRADLFDGSEDCELAALSARLSSSLDLASLRERALEAIEKKDRYTCGHTRRVEHYAAWIARHLGLSEQTIERIRLAALLHDVGKIGVEDRILKKESSLEGGEWQAMQRHPELGYGILGGIEGLEDVTAGMRFHHERWDGRGYPLGLRGDEIPLIARVIAVADTYDAMVSTRPYRRGLAPKSAFDEIVRNRGSQFDPAVVDAFARAFQGGASSRAESLHV